MREITVEVELGPNEPMYITPYSDVHFDSRDHDTGWSKHYAKRAALPNSHFLNLGDFGNLVMPRDMKRHTPSTPRDGYAERDDYINKFLYDVEHAIKKEPATWDLWCLGNHEVSVLKHHSIDVASLIADRLGVNYGSYSGHLYYRIIPKGRKKDTRLLHILYHHGAWGGVVVEGRAGAMRWALDQGGWHIMVYGHNHRLSSTARPYWQSGPIKSQSFTRFFVNTGTWQKTLSREGSPDYAEQRGLPMSPIGTPLIKVWFERHNTRNTELHYSVETESWVAAHER